MAIWFIAVAVVFTVATLGWEQRQIRKKHRTMAAARAPLTEEQFFSEMEARGVSSETAEYLRSWLLYAYRDALQPEPDDRIFSDLNVLGEDAIEFVDQYFERFGGSWPQADSPLLSDPSLVELGTWLDRQRQ